MRLVSGSGGISRRTLLKAGSAAAGLGALGSLGGLARPALAASEAATITFAYFGDPKQATSMRESLLPLVKKADKNADLKVVGYNGTDWNDFFAKILTQIAAGAPPDIVGVATEGVQLMAGKDLAIPLDDYVVTNCMTLAQASVIRSAVASKLNIVVAGGTGSGKTTLTNAILAEIVALAPDDRLVILEDTAEIQCAADNAVCLHTSDTVDMSRLLKSTMRLRPDRIIVGEVRDGAALTLLKSWNTGHPGGIATIHSNSARSALLRLEQLTAEASQQPMQAVIGDAVDLVIFIDEEPELAAGRKVRELLLVTGYADGQYQVEHV